MFWQVHNGKVWLKQKIAGEIQQLTSSCPLILTFRCIQPAANCKCHTYRHKAFLLRWEKKKCWQTFKERTCELTTFQGATGENNKVNTVYSWLLLFLTPSRAVRNVNHLNFRQQRMLNSLSLPCSHQTLSLQATLQPIHQWHTQLL